MSLPHLILGLLKETPLSGYDLNKAFQSTVYHFWTTDQSQIYRALHKMLEKQWVDVEVIVQEDNPNKKVYHITEAGQEEMHRWLISDFPATPVREVWLGHIFFTTPDELPRLIDKLQDELKTTQARHDALISLSDELPDYDNPNLGINASLRLITLDYGKHHYQSDIAWLRHMIDWLRGKLDEWHNAKTVNKE
jgi:PadR family transcriptional regulator, regulatory protein AphA